MQSSKSQILAVLKRKGRCSVDDLVGWLSLAPMTVRQHLTTLERDGLVQSVEERQRLGRPHFVYFLTETGEESFPKRYDRIAMELLHEVGLLGSDEIAGLSPGEKTALLFDKLGDRFVAQYRPRMEPMPLRQRVAAVADLLQTESGFAEWGSTDEGYEVRDYNCFYRKLNAADGESCRWHERVLAGLLGCQVYWRQEAAGGAQLCRFAVFAEAGADAVALRQDVVAGKNKVALTLPGGMHR
jgi:predicted ArsR family transcriptional regulator